MKKFIIGLLLSIAAVPQLFAQGRNGVFKVTLSDGSPLVITIDDRRYTKYGPSLTIGDLPPGKHKIKVYAFDEYRNREGGRARLLYTGKITIAPGTIAHGIFDVKGGSMRVSSEPIVSHNDNYNSKPNNEQPVADNNYPGQFSSKDMADLKARVDDRITDNDKLKLMKSALEGRHFSSGQVDDMLHWFNFDDTKLEFAKWAFNGTTDPQNYWKLESNFSFGSTKDNFQKYVNSKK